MSNPLIFDPKVLQARKTHKCWACLRDIPKGRVYVAYPGKNSAGEFQSTKLCDECSFLLTQKDGANAHTIRQGEFSERLLPNCLRKKRNEFRKDPRKAIEDAELIIATLEPVPPKYCKQIVVKGSEFDRRIFHLPEEPKPSPQRWRN